MMGRKVNLILFFTLVTASLGKHNTSSKSFEESTKIYSSKNNGTTLSDPLGGNNSRVEYVETNNDEARNIVHEGKLIEPLVEPLVEKLENIQLIDDSEKVTDVEKDKEKSTGEKIKEDGIGDFFYKLDDELRSRFQDKKQKDGAKPAVKSELENDSKPTVNLLENNPESTQIEQDEKSSVGKLPFFSPIPLMRSVLPLLIPIPYHMSDNVSLVPMLPRQLITDRLPAPEAEVVEADSATAVVKEGVSDKEISEAAKELISGLLEGLLGVRLPVPSPIPYLPTRNSKESPLHEASSKLVDLYGRKFILNSKMSEHPLNKNSRLFLRFMSIRPLEVDRSPEKDKDLDTKENIPEPNEKEDVDQHHITKKVIEEKEKDEKSKNDVFKTMKDPYENDMIHEPKVFTVDGSQSSKMEGSDILNTEGSSIRETKEYDVSVPKKADVLKGAETEGVKTEETPRKKSVEYSKSNTDGSSLKSRQSSGDSKLETTVPTFELADGNLKSAEKKQDDKFGGKATVGSIDNENVSNKMKSEQFSVGKDSLNHEDGVETKKTYENGKESFKSFDLSSSTSSTAVDEKARDHSFTDISKLMKMEVDKGKIDSREM